MNQRAHRRFHNPFSLMRLDIDEIEAPLVIIALGVILALATPIVGQFDCDAFDTASTLLDISQALITGGLGGAVFKPLRSR